MRERVRSPLTAILVTNNSTFEDVPGFGDGGTVYLVGPLIFVNTGVQAMLFKFTDQADELAIPVAAGASFVYEIPPNVSPVLDAANAIQAKALAGTPTALVTAWTRGIGT